MKSYKFKINGNNYTVEIQSVEDLEQQIQNLDDYYKYVLNIVCPFEIKGTVKS